MWSCAVRSRHQGCQKAIKGLPGCSRASFSSLASWAAMANSSQKTNLIGFTRYELRDFMDKTLNVKAKASDQLFKQIYRNGCTMEDLMNTDILGPQKRQALKDAAGISYGNVLDDQTCSVDGTRKWLLNVGPGLDVEAVLIPESSSKRGDHGTLCLSSQVGCSLACSFCHTGTQPLLKNLSPGQILSQLQIARRSVGDFPAENPKISNVVFMGQGEPLYNKRSVWRAVHTLTDPFGGNIAPKRLTISTSGVAPLMPKVGTELGVNLALSLHAVDDETRTYIMNINKTYSLGAVMEACRGYRDSRGNRETQSKGRRILFEYTPLRGVNDSLDEAHRLVDLVKEFNCHVNIIPFNPWPGAPYEPSDDDSMMQFGKVLLNNGISATIRWPKGREIMAACGQLRTDFQQKANMTT